MQREGGIRMFRIRKEAEPDEHTALLSALGEARTDLAAARSAFEVCEPELVEALVYELNAREARYNYLLGRLRELEVRSPLRFRPALRREG